MPQPMGRRRLFRLGGATLSAAALAAFGLDACSSGPHLVPQPTFKGLETATNTPSPTPTDTPSPTPTATPTPLPPQRPTWSATQLATVMYSVPTTAPLVALTLDDGWSERMTVLNLLKEQALRLTFFLTGAAVRGDREFIAEALNAGMEIGNHTMDHADLTRKTPGAIQQDVIDFEQLVASTVTGASTKPYLRPPGGAVNVAVANAAAAIGYRPINWNSSSGDGSASTTPEQMVKYAMSHAAPGSIILMHFGPRALIAIPPLVEQLRAKGLEPVSLTKLIASA